LPLSSLLSPLSPLSFLIRTTSTAFLLVEFPKFGKRLNRRSEQIMEAAHHRRKKKTTFQSHSRAGVRVADTSLFLECFSRKQKAVVNTFIFSHETLQVGGRKKGLVERFFSLRRESV
jgi:hypothetical protein